MTEQLRIKRDELAERFSSAYREPHRDAAEAFYHAGFNSACDILLPLIEECKKVLDEECYCNEHEGCMVICDPCIVLSKIESVIGEVSK